MKNKQKSWLILLVVIMMLSVPLVSSLSNFKDGINVTGNSTFIGQVNITESLIVNGTAVVNGSLVGADCNVEGNCPNVAYKSYDYYNSSKLNTTVFKDESGFLGIVYSFWEGLYLKLTGGTITGSLNVTNDLDVGNDINATGTVYAQDVITNGFSAGADGQLVYDKNIVQTQVKVLNASAIALGLSRNVDDSLTFLVENPNASASATSKLSLVNDLGSDFSCVLTSSGFVDPDHTACGTDAGSGFNLYSENGNLSINTYDQAENVISIGDRQVDIIANVTVGGNLNMSNKNIDLVTCIEFSNGAMWGPPECFS